jgi:quinol monooxygenase YgiN
MFEVTARLKVRDGELDGFKRQAAEVMRQARAKDTKTLRYDWFLADDGTECEVREGYVDPDALLEHSEHVGEAREELFREYAYDHDMTLYGEPSPGLAATFAAMAGHVVVHRYSLFQQLDGAPDQDAVSPFEATAQLQIRNGGLEGLERQVAEIVRQTNESDTRPLRYDWFLSDDGAECEVREAYVDGDSLLEHQRLTADAKMHLLHNFVAGHTMTFYDEPSRALAQTLETQGATYRRFSLFQALETGSEVPEEVPA